jgi:hypothetical protein
LGNSGDFFVAYGNDKKLCFTAENLMKEINVEKVLKHFTGNSLTNYEAKNEWVKIPEEGMASYFQIIGRFEDN